MMALIDVLRLIFKLGIGSIFSVLYYRLKCRLGYFPNLSSEADSSALWSEKGLLNNRDISFFSAENVLHQRHLSPSGKETSDPFLILPEEVKQIEEELEEIRLGIFRVFFYHKVQYPCPTPKAASTPTIPVFDFLYHPVLKKSFPAEVDFYKQQEFDQIRPAADIKWIWDLSRFHWCLTLARAIACPSKFDLEKREGYLQILEAQLQQWVEQNPAYLGLNWRCGQEAGFRVLHLSVVVALLQELSAPSQKVLAFISMHLKRIYETISYAEAQKNNHVITESLALVVGSQLLITCCGAKAPQATLKFLETGRRILQRQIQKLIQDDGSFPLYSMNYYRSVLQCLNIYFYLQCQGLPLPQLTKSEREKVEKLYLFIKNNTVINKKNQTESHSSSRFAPMVGPNDGSYPFKLNTSDYLDYQPALETFAHFYSQVSRFNEKNFVPDFQVYRDFGWAVRCSSSITYFLRFPSFRFRPIEDDVAHIDVWIHGVNVLLDSGTYSYTNPLYIERFTRQSAHNTVDLGSKFAMKRLGRFLFLDWRKPSRLQFARDQQMLLIKKNGLEHQRIVDASCLDQQCQIKMIDSGWAGAEGGIFRLHLNPTLQWKLQGPSNPMELTLQLHSELCSIHVTVECSLKSFRLAEHPVSTFYGEVSNVPTLEVEVNEGNFKIISEINAVRRD